MSQSDDLSKLFQRFGGRTETYKEIVREDAAAQARERWPLLSAMRVDRAAVVPAVQPAVPPGHEFARPAASPAPLWRAAAPASEPPPATEPVRENVGHEAPSALNTAVSGMVPRFRMPEGMAPLAPAAGPLTPAAPAAASGPAIPAPQQSSLWAPADPNRAAGTGTELNKVFARLEGRKEPGATSERAPARRSFLDRLNRS